jgi:Family of unknown function (DUF6220)
VTQSRVLFFGLAVAYLGGVIVQFFLAGLGSFAATGYDPHRALGLILALVSLVLVVLAFAGKVPRALHGFALLLLGLNVLQIVLVQIDVPEIAALHVVNALVIAYVAVEIAERSRRYLTAKLGT